MGGSGTMTAINAVIKSNRKLRRNVNREKFKRTFGKYKSKGKPEYDFPKAQLHTIRRLKERMIYENEQINKKKNHCLLLQFLSYLLQYYLHIIM